MSYKISYGDNGNERCRQPHIFKVVAALLMVLLVVAARLCYPDETKQLSQALFPLTSVSSQQAIEVFKHNISAGESLGDAITAFCQEIINEADIS